MNWKKTCALLLSLIFAASLVAGCGGGTTAPATSQVLRVSAGAEPETLDPRLAIGLPEMQVLKQVFEGLCNQSSKGEIVPGAAEKWEVSPDGMKYKFTLRANAKWSNGDPVTAQDFEFAWKSALSPELASRYAEQLFPLKNGEAYNKKKVTADEVGVKALDDRTLEVTLEKPTPYFLFLTTFPTYFPVNKKVVTANEKWAGDPKTLIGNGPFKLTAWAHNSKLEFAKNENYWQKDVVKLEKVEFLIVDQGTTLLNMFENNQVDLTTAPNPPASEMPRLIKEGKLQVTPYVGHYHYVINCKRPPLDNVKVRKALALAIDRTAIIDTLVKSGEQPAMAWVPLGLPDVAAGSEFRKVGGDFFKNNDVETARKLLAEAGYPDGKGFPEMTLLFNTDEQHKQIAEALQEMWKKNLGITLKLQNQEWKVYLQARAKRDFDLVRRGWIGDYLDPMTAMETMLGGNPNNNSEWQDPEYDRLVREAQKTADSQKRIQLMHDAEKVLMDDMPIIPIYFMMQKHMAKPYVKGYFLDGLGSLYLREAYIDKK
ncbi:MAG TPA: peptide ABC transporter substrate-binding protein [Selenomonadales bacterium]|nr:peptide ABC transporter substrate-binding protein [Selenomonadales bacterium]